MPQVNVTGSDCSAIMTSQPSGIMFALLVTGGLALLAQASCCWTQAYPLRPIRVINTVAAGGPAELVARTIGQKLTEAS